MCVVEGKKKSIVRGRKDEFGRQGRNWCGGGRNWSHFEHSDQKTEDFSVMRRRLMLAIRNEVRREME